MLKSCFPKIEFVKCQIRVLCVVSRESIFTRTWIKNPLSLLFIGRGTNVWDTAYPTNWQVCRIIIDFGGRGFSPYPTFLIRLGNSGELRFHREFDCHQTKEDKPISLALQRMGGSSLRGILTINEGPLSLRLMLPTLAQHSKSPEKTWRQPGWLIYYDLFPAAGPHFDGSIKGWRPFGSFSKIDFMGKLFNLKPQRSFRRVESHESWDLPLIELICRNQLS